MGAILALLVIIVLYVVVKLKFVVLEQEEETIEGGLELKPKD